MSITVTVIVISSLAWRSLSSAVSLNTYVPASEKEALVSTAFSSVNDTVPGPLCFVHVVVTAAGGFGKPSSDTVPSNIASAGKVACE